MEDIMLARALILGLVLVGCGDKDEEEENSAPPLDNTGDDSADPECSGTPPVVQEVSCVNTGVQPHYETGEDTVTMQIWANVTDEDGDLTYYTLELFYDDEIDGEIDTSSSAFAPSNGAVEADECEAGEVDLGLTLYLPGGDPAFDTEYEWGYVVTDGGGLSSEVGITTCYTPTSEGEDGGAG